MSYAAYDPDPAAIPRGITFTRILSQRDLGLTVPINFVTVPGVALTAACFPNDRYVDASAARCFSNLLASGFRKFEIDIYWDSTRHVWSLCPVELGNPKLDTNVSTATPQGTATPSNGSTSANSTGQTSSRGSAVFNLLRDLNPARRQDKTPSTSSLLPTSQSKINTATLPTVPSVTSTATLTTNTHVSAGTSTASPTHSAGTVIDIGPYSCTTSTNFDLLTDVLASHLKITQTNVNATMKYLVLNLHAAAPAASPGSSANAPTSENLPQHHQFLNSLLYKNMSRYLYTPHDLREQRANLNASGNWFGVVHTSEPNTAYFHVHASKDHTSTPDGWPSEAFVEMEYGQRLLAGFGTVDPQMQHYNFSADASAIFPRHYLQREVPVTANAHGHIKDGCFFDPDVHSVKRINNSWAMYEEKHFPANDRGLQKALTEANTLTNCGISPVLNKTLRGVTADQDYKPYAEFAGKSIWAWAPGEPDSEGPDTGQARCAALNADTGSWVTRYCGVSFFSACANMGQPYTWTISRSRATYADAGISCPPGTQFNVPRTSLQNAYLMDTWQQFKSDQDIEDELLWINFNDVDVKGCWVIGQNQTCPYVQEQSSKRTVLVPTIAAVIVFCLAVLTIFVKCAANRQRSKRRRRRGDDGWDYEGVPS